MKFNPITKCLYTDNGEFIKKLNCPYKINWEDMEVIDLTIRKCLNCDHMIVDTGTLKDEQLFEMVRQNPSTCLKIDLNQSNLKIVVNTDESHK
jgi:hypothetical protein